MEAPNQKRFFKAVPRFDGPLLKLARARTHIQEFISKAEVFYESVSPKLYIEDYEPRKERALCLRGIPKEVPKEFPLIIGDAIHNLRSSLDHMTWDLVSIFNPSKPEQVQFPFCKSAKSMEDALRMRQVHLAGAEIADKFRDLKPYPDGNELLYALHKLDIADKHQLIVPVVALLGFDGFSVRDVDPTAPDIKIENMSFSNILNDNRIAVWRYDPAAPWRRPTSGPDIGMTFQVLFAKDQPLGGKSVAARLLLIADLIEGTIRRFQE